MSQTLRRRADPKRKMDWFCVFVMATRKMHALMQVHLTTANQSEIYLALCEKVINLIHSFIHIPFFRFCGWRCGKSDLHNYFPVICRIL